MKLMRPVLTFLTQGLGVVEGDMEGRLVQFVSSCNVDVHTAHDLSSYPNFYESTW